MALLAHQNKSTVGFALVYPSFDTVSLQSCWRLDALWVAPGSRRTGVGTELLAAVAAAAKAEAIQSVIVHPNEGSDDAQVNATLNFFFLHMCPMR